MIVVVSHHRDEHAQAVMVELSHLGAETTLLDLSRFPLQLGLSMSYTGNGRNRFAFGCEQSSLDLGDCGSIWWRRPQHPTVEGAIGRREHQTFALNESAEALQGLWQCSDAFWMNKPAADAIANRKGYQLQVAASLGLATPETLITNCPTAARQFVQRIGLGSVIYKAFSATEQDWRETRLVRESELGEFDNIKYAPVIFQRYIEADVDIRVTMVDGEIFAAAIFSQETEYKVDFRMDIANARIEAIKLPNNVEQKLLALMSSLDLAYGAIDLRRGTDGEHVFLEINPAGQWLFVEQMSGQPITKALAASLFRHDGAGADPTYASERCARFKGESAAKAQS